MTIQANVQRKIDEIEGEIEARAINPDASITKTQELHDKAMAAMFNGNQSQQWIDYMTLFAGTPTNKTELARLIPTDGTHTNPDMQEARAYLVANGLCLMGTTTALHENVTNRLG